MSAADAKDTKDIDYLSMSDDEILKMPVPDFSEAVVADADDDAPEGKAADTGAASSESDGGEGAGAQADAEDADDDEDEAQAEAKSAEAADGEAADDAEEGEGEKKDAPADPEAAKTEVKEPSKDEKSEKSDENAEKKPTDDKPVDFEAEYKRLLAPFKANGREIKVESVDDAISLMQMGANYNKKMAALKPNLKLMKLLENNGLLSEEKLSFLIDLDKKNPDAINKLVKDSGIDPMEFDADKASGYKQSTYTVDDKEIELDSVLEELQDTPSYKKTLDVVGNKWDAASKQVVAGAPQLLKVINDHITCGIYDLISAEIDRERMFGRLQGLSDIEAYRQVGDSLHAKGAFNHLSQGSSQAQGKPTPAPVVVQPKPKMAEDDKRKDKKRAASPSKPAPTTPANDGFNPLSMSDEEFAKLSAPKYA